MSLLVVSKRGIPIHNAYVDVARNTDLSSIRAEEV
jgi:hypothetical protein